MQRILLLFIAVFTTGCLLSQNAPIANDDYVDVGLGDIVTINVVNNDFHPDSLSFSIYNAPGPCFFTDSTITYNIDYEYYYNVADDDTLVFTYTIKDENGNMGIESIAKVRLTIKANNYFDFLDHNNIRARIQASGLQFWPGPSETGYKFPVFEFPKGSCKNTIFNSTLWVGGMDESGELKLAAERFRQAGMD